MSLGQPAGGVSLDPADRNWERALEVCDGVQLPDCRLKPIERDRAKFLWGGRIELDRVFCANCGKSGGATFPDCPHIFYLCDACARKNGTPPGAALAGPNGGLLMRAPEGITLGVGAMPSRSYGGAPPTARLYRVSENGIIEVCDEADIGELIKQGFAPVTE